MDHPLEHGASGMMDVSLSPTRDKAASDNLFDDLAPYPSASAAASDNKDGPRLLPVSLPSSIHNQLDSGDASADTEQLLVEPLQQGAAKSKPLATLDIQEPSSAPSSSTAGSSTYVGAISSTAASLVKHIKKLSLVPAEQDLAGLAASASSGAAAAAAATAVPASPGKALADDLELSHQSADHPLKLWLSDPERTEGTNKMGLKVAVFYYNVRVESSLPGFPSNAVTVRRRFSDFDQLHHMLKHHYHGYFVPPMPEKSFLESKITGRDSFLRVRRSDLQAYIRAVASHPVLRSSEEVKLFLTLPGELGYQPQWVQLVEHRASMLEQLRGLIGMMDAGQGGGSSNGTGGSSGAGASSSNGASSSFLPSFMTRMRSALVGFPISPSGYSDDELALRTAKEQLRELQQHLQLACNAARTMVRHMESLCEDLSELGRSFSVMARYEESVGSKLGQYTERGQLATRTGNDLQKMGYASLRQHNLWKQFTVRIAASLVFLHDYYVTIPEAVATLEAREQLLANLRLLEQDLADRQQQLARGEVAAQGGAGDKRLAVLRQVTQGQQHYAEVKERNKQELARLQLERYTDFKQALGNFAAVQSQLMSAASDIWASAAQLYMEQPEQE